MTHFILFLLFLLGIYLLLIHNEKFTSLADIASTGQCSMQCRRQDGNLVDPTNCCLCKTSGGYVTGPKESEDPAFRKCMCDLGTGYESYCYKLATNFLLSQ